MKKFLHLIFAAFYTITAFGQKQDLKSHMIPFQKQFDLEQSLNSNSYLTGELKLDSLINQLMNQADSTFINNFKDTYLYDSNKKQISETQYNWDNIGGKWYPFVKIEYSYDVDGHLSLQMNYIMDESTSQWNQTAKTEYIKNQSGKDTLIISSSWNKTLGDWVAGMQKKLTYDNAGNLAMYALYTLNYENSQWDTTMKSEFFQNETGSDTLSVVSFWDANARQWDTTSKTNTNYDNKGNDTLVSVFNWNLDPAQWTPILKTINCYDSEDRDSVVTSYIWDVMANQWNFNYKNESFYDVNSNTKLTNLYMGLDGQWLQSSHYIYYYSGYTVTGIPDQSQSSIRVYPNPAREFIVIDMPDISNSATIQIFNVQGKKVLDLRVTEGKQISTGNLPKGIYLYRINNRGNNCTGKLVIK
jgi:CRISPR/Cas system-associated endoribonuclease Cas2